MWRHQILTWLFSVVVAITASSDNDLTKIYHDLCSNYKSVQDQMLSLKTEINFELERLANTTFTKLEEREVKRLENGFSTCYRIWMSMMRTEIGSLMITQYPAPCSELLDQILNEIDAQMTKGDVEIGTVIDHIDICMNDPNNCTTNYELSNLRRKVFLMRDRWLEYKKNDYVEEWRKMIRCYAYLSVAVESRLSELSVHAGKCGTMTYEQFLNQTGLLSFSLHKFIGPALASFNVDELPRSEWRAITEYQEKSDLTQVLRLSRTMITQYIRRDMTSAMHSVVNAAFTDIFTLLTSILNQPTVSKEPCYQGVVQSLFRAINENFNGDLLELCFYGLVDARNEFNNIIRCDLLQLEGRLSTIRNCWADEEICHEISTRAKKFQSSLTLWKLFNLTTPMEDARNCYSKANHVIYGDVIRSIERLKKCENVSVPNLHQEITKPQHTYPPYEKSAVCPSAPKHTDI